MGKIKELENDICSFRNICAEKNSCKKENCIEDYLGRKKWDLFEENYLVYGEWVPSIRY